MQETEREEVWMGRRRPRSSSGVLAEVAKGGDDKEKAESIGQSGVQSMGEARAEKTTK